MIIHHQRNVAAFVGAHTYWFLPQQILSRRISVTTAAAANNEIEQARSINRFVFSRVFSRVN